MHRGNMSIVKQLALRSVHKVSELWQQMIFWNCFTNANNVWSPAKFIINNNAKVSVLMNLFNMSLRLRLRWSGRSWYFCLVVSSIRFVFAGCKIIALLSHQSDASFMLLSSSFCKRDSMTEHGVMQREYNKVQACFVLETFLLRIFALEGFVKACPVGLTDSYKT